MPNEVNQRKIHTVWYHLYVGSKKCNKLVNTTKKKKGWGRKKKNLLLLIIPKEDHGDIRRADTRKHINTRQKTGIRDVEPCSTGIRPKSGHLNIHHCIPCFPRCDLPD